MEIDWEAFSERGITIQSHFEWLSFESIVILILKRKNMKKMNKINLNQLAKKQVDMKKVEMSEARGGFVPQSGACVCVCIEPSCPTSNYPIGTHSNQAV